MTAGILLHCDGTNGSTSFPDSSGNGHIVTVNGAAQVSTAQSVFGGASASFDGVTGTFLNVDGSSDFVFGTGDFTIDFRVRMTVKNGKDVFCDWHPNNDFTNSYPNIYWSGNQLVFLNGLIQGGVNNPQLNLDTWYHVAVTRAGGQSRMFLNGSQAGSTTADTNNYLCDPSGPFIGENSASPGNGDNLQGWIDEFRILNGVAAWTSNFTPPTAPYGQVVSQSFGIIGLGTSEW